MTNDPNEIEERVITEIRKRRDVGRKKYGVSMERTDLTHKQWLQHAKEEALDFVIYLEKQIKMIEDEEELALALAMTADLANLKKSAGSGSDY